MELLVRIIDKGPTDLHSKRGDVIAVCPDGWKWSSEELSNPIWRILVLKNINSKAHLDLITPKTIVEYDGNTSLKNNKTIAKRSINLDLDHPLLDLDTVNYINDNSRINSKMSISLGTLMAIKKNR